MPIVYSSTAIDDRLLGVVTAIGNGGNLVLLANGSTVSAIALASPSGTVGGQVLSFTTPALDASAPGSATGVNEAEIQDSNGDTIVSGFTVGIPGSGADIIISNGLNSTVISAGQSVSLVAGQIIGS